MKKQPTACIFSKKRLRQGIFQWNLKNIFLHLRTCPFIMLIQWPPITVLGISNPRSAKHFFHTFKDITTCFIQICKNSIYLQIKTSPVLFYFFPNILNVKVCILQTRRSQTSDFNILSFWISICFFIMFSTFANSEKHMSFTFTEGEFCWLLNFSFIYFFFPQFSTPFLFILPIGPCQTSTMNRSSHRRCSVKKVLLEILQNSQENTCSRVSF